MSLGKVSRFGAAPFAGVALLVIALIVAFFGIRNRLSDRAVHSCRHFGLHFLGDALFNLSREPGGYLCFQRGDIHPGRLQVGRIRQPLIYADDPRRRLPTGVRLRQTRHRPGTGRGLEAQMKTEYDFSNSRKNPYAKQLKRQITIRIDTAAVAYFKQMAAERGMPYQNLINLFLRDGQ